MLEHSDNGAVWVCDACHTHNNVGTGICRICQRAAGSTTGSDVEFRTDPATASARPTQPPPEFRESKDKRADYSSRDKSRVKINAGSSASAGTRPKKPSRPSDSAASVPVPPPPLVPSKPVAGPPTRPEPRRRPRILTVVFLLFASFILLLALLIANAIDDRNANSMGREAGTTGPDVPCDTTVLLRPGNPQAIA